MHSSSAPSPPPPPEPPPPPTIVDPSVQQNEARDRARRKRGRAATMLTGLGGVSAPANTGTKMLLGD
jgi:hypothetical protein